MKKKKKVLKMTTKLLLAEESQKNQSPGIQFNDELNGENSIENYNPFYMGLIAGKALN